MEYFLFFFVPQSCSHLEKQPHTVLEPCLALKQPYNDDLQEENRKVTEHLAPREEGKQTNKRSAAPTGILQSCHQGTGA